MLMAATSSMQNARMLVVFVAAVVAPFSSSLVRLSSSSAKARIITLIFGSPPGAALYSCCGMVPAVTMVEISPNAVMLKPQALMSLWVFISL